jgi:hypothetical protein
MKISLEQFSRKMFFLIILLIITLNFYPVVADDKFSFYAEYDQVFQKDGISISDAAMSDDGTMLIFSGYDDNSKRSAIYMLKIEGSELTGIPLPEDINDVEGVAINRDGSRAFFVANHHLIFKVEDGTATKIHEEDGPAFIMIGSIKATTDGDYVYFNPYPGNGILRISQSGGTPEMIVEASKVPVEDAKGTKIPGFDISADGKKILISLSIDIGARRLYLYDDGDYRLISKKAGNNFENFAISGDGDTIVFGINDPDKKVYSISSEPGAEIALTDYNTGQYVGMALSYDGSKLFYRDIGKVQLINTDGSNLLDILTSFGISPNFPSLSLSDDKQRISFRAGNALYVGYLNNTSIVPGAPIIESINFDPKSMPVNDPNSRIYLKAKISDPQGLADITNTQCDELLDGHIYQNDRPKVPAFFYFDPNDKGTHGDEIAGDGIFSSEGEPGGKIGNFSQMTVRVSAMDRDKTVVVADAILTIGNGISPSPADTLPPLLSPTPEQMSEWLSLYENAPVATETISEGPDNQSQIDTSPGDYEGGSFSLLDYLQYDPDERHQGSCGNCWQWAGTAVMEIQLDYRKKIKDRLSIEYINSNLAGPLVEGEACCGDWLDTFTKYYADRGQAIPWTNLNAGWMDGGVECKTCPDLGESTVPAGSTSTSPAYPIASIRTERILTHGLGAATAINNIKSLLHQGKAIWFAYYLPNREYWNQFGDFWKNQQEDIVYQIDSADGTQYNYTKGEGSGHAVVIVGYDETDPNNRYWIVLNSWGTENGLRPNGLFRVSMDMNYDCQYTGFVQGKYYSDRALYFETLDVTYSDQDKKGSIDLTGVWSCNDGGIYYLRQIGDTLWWDGNDPNGGWANVANGSIEGNTISMRFADVPEGRTTGSGRLILNIISNDELGALEKPDGYGGSRWWRSSETQPPEPPIDTDPWNDPIIRGLIDEWLGLQDKCLKQDEPEQYVDSWARNCQSQKSCEIEPDHPAGWDNYHWIWINALGPGHLGINIRDYVERRQNGESYESLAICKG